MLFTSRRNIAYPDPLRSDRPDVPAHLATLAAALDVDVIYGQGALGARPNSTPTSPGIPGRFYVSTDTIPFRVDYDFGIGWLTIFPTATAPLANSIVTAMIADNAITAAKLALLAVGTAQLADGAVSGVKVAADLKPSAGAAGATETLRALGFGAGLAIGTNQISSINRVGLRGARPGPETVPAGVRYFATDQIVEWISDGAANWIRTGTPAGATLSWYGATAPPGFYAYDGSILPAGDIYSDLLAHLGSSQTWDTRARAEVGLGTNTAVNAIGKSEGITNVLNRRGLFHAHTPHIHGNAIAATGSFAPGATAGMVPGGNYNTLAADGGSGVATDPLDGGAFITTLKIAKL